MRLLDEQGRLCLDEMVLAHPGFQRVMADGVITDDEIAAQAQAAVALLKRLDETLSDEDRALAAQVIVELSVLQELYNRKERG